MVLDSLEPFNILKGINDQRRAKQEGSFGGGMKNKTTAKHFSIFKEECEKWIEKFGLKGWRIHYSHTELDDAWAKTRYNMNGRTITIFLTLDWGGKVKLRDLKMSAFHEVCEVLLCRLKTIGESRYIQEDELQEEVHNIIRTLENVLWEEKCGN